MNIKEFRGIDLLRELCLAFGPSGCEEGIADMIKENIEGNYDELVPDRMGGVIAKISGSDPSKRVMVSAHMDEVGFMIREICEDGLLRFSSLMGGDTRIMAARRVTVRGKEGDIRGVLAIKPVHVVGKDDRDKAEPIDNIYIDIGAKDKEEAEKYVSIGDYATFESDFVQFGENGRLLKGKALDDRLGCAVMCDVMAELYKAKKEGKLLPYDLYFAFTCREELGLSLARCAAHKIDPQRAIIIETTAVADIHGVPDTSKVAVRGEGGAVSVMDRGTIYSKEMVDHLLAVANEEEIPCQIKKYVSGGNDAMHIHKAAGGAKCAVISAPCGYIHTASDVVATEDYHSIYKLVLSSLSKLK